MRAGHGDLRLAWRVVARHSCRSLAGSDCGAGSTIRVLPYSGPAMVSRITTGAPHRHRAQGAGLFRCAPVVVDRVPFMAAVRLRPEPGRRLRSMPKHMLDFGTALRPFGRLLPHYRIFRRLIKVGIGGGDSHQPRSARAFASCDTVHDCTDRGVHSIRIRTEPFSRPACATASSSPNRSLAYCAKV